MQPNKMIGKALKAGSCMRVCFAVVRAWVGISVVKLYWGKVQGYSCEHGQGSTNEKPWRLQFENKCCVISAAEKSSKSLP
jgi:hypothetical protein